MQGKGRQRAEKGKARKGDDDAKTLHKWAEMLLHLKDKENRGERKVV